MIVALFADRWILPGLHATLASLLAHADHSAPLRIVVFGEKLTDREKQILDDTARPRLGQHHFEIRDFVTPVTRKVRSLHGNYTTYGRLFLPELLPDADACLYLDCDLIVTRDLDALFALATSGEPLYADGTGVRGDSLDRPTFASLGMSLAAPYFNGGVLVFNLERWRREKITGRCVDFAEKHGRLLLSADQTVLNVVLGDSFGRFGEVFNTALWPSTPPLAPAEQSGRVFHFVGAPKPWDYLGRYANRNYALWQHWAAQTAWFDDWPSGVVAHLGVYRGLRVGRATFRELEKRYSPWRS